MRKAATLQDDRNFFATTTYSLWDADKIYGCMCDYGFTGHNCALRECPKGDEPATTGQLDEIQRVNCLCNGCTGTFTLSFRGETTANIAPTATLATLEAALEALKTVNDVTIALSGAGSTVCDTDGATVSITFIKNPGDLPPLIPTSSLTGGTSLLTVSNGGTSGTYDAVGASVDGTREVSDIPWLNISRTQLDSTLIVQTEGPVIPQRAFVPAIRVLPAVMELELQETWAIVAMALSQPVPVREYVKGFFYLS